MTDINKFAILYATKKLQQNDFTGEERRKLAIAYCVHPLLQISRIVELEIEKRRRLREQEYYKNKPRIFRGRGNTYD